LALFARVVHSKVFTSGESGGGDGILRYQSGLFFVDVTADQQALLAAILERLSPGSSTGEYPQRS
jgi:hypothetical protein